MGDVTTAFTTNSVTNTADCSSFTATLPVANSADGSSLTATLPVTNSADGSSFTATLLVTNSADGSSFTATLPVTNSADGSSFTATLLVTNSAVGSSFTATLPVTNSAVGSSFTAQTLPVTNSADGSSSTAQTLPVTNSADGSSFTATLLVTNSAVGSSFTATLPVTNSAVGSSFTAQTLPVTNSADGSSSTAQTLPVTNSADGSSSTAQTLPVTNSADGSSSTAQTLPVTSSADGSSSTAQTLPVTNSADGSSFTAQTLPVTNSAECSSSTAQTLPVTNSADGSSSTAQTLPATNSAECSSSTAQTLPVTNSADGSSSTAQTLPVTNSADGSSSTAQNVPVTNSADGSSSTAQTLPVTNSADFSSSTAQTLPVTNLSVDTSSTSPSIIDITFELIKLHACTQSSCTSTWTPVYSAASIQLCMMKTASMSQVKVERSITINADLSWHVHVAGKLLDNSIKVLQEIPNQISSINCLQNIMHCVKSAYICPGNPQLEFVEIVSSRSSLSSKGEFVDSEMEVVDIDGCTYGRTVRTSDCELLCTDPKRCKSCVIHRSNLRVAKCRQQHKNSDRIAHDSHCNIRFLSEHEISQRLESAQNQKNVLREKVKRLEQEKRAQKLIAKEGVTLTRNDENDINSILTDADITTAFEEDSFQSIFWEQQKKYNSLKTKNQMRWHPLIIRFALSLRCASSAAYRTVSSSGLLSLPSERTLRDYTHWCKLQNGVHFPLIKKAKEILSKESIEGEERQFALVMDEMKIKHGLVFRKHTGDLVGFCDLGTVNQELEAMATTRSPKLAEQMLVFMVRPIFKPSLTFMIASYASTNLSGEKLYVPVWEIVEALEYNKMPVLSLTSDGAAPNRCLYKLCRIKEDTHKTPNPYADRDLYFFCDPPHLIKTARNCLSNSGAHSRSRNLMVSVILFEITSVIFTFYRKMVSPCLGSM